MSIQISNTLVTNSDVLNATSIPGVVATIATPYFIKGSTTLGNSSTAFYPLLDSNGSQIVLPSGIVTNVLIKNNTSLGPSFYVTGSTVSNTSSVTSLTGTVIEEVGTSTVSTSGITHTGTAFSATSSKQQDIAIGTIPNIATPIYAYLYSSSTTTPSPSTATVEVTFRML
jgi:hypothetical protein